MSDDDIVEWFSRVGDFLVGTVFGMMTVLSFLFVASGGWVLAVLFAICAVLTACMFRDAPWRDET